MYFHKIRHPANFRFADAHDGRLLSFETQSMDLEMRDLGDDVFHVELRQPGRWPMDPRLLRMHEDCFGGASTYALDCSARGELVLRDGAGACVLHGFGGRSFGVCGEAWLVQWARNAEMRFYGQGYKVTGLEKTGRRTKFWNLDVASDHSVATVADGAPDPQYVSVPYLLVRAAKSWLGILVDHPGSVFMDTGSNWNIGGQPEPPEDARFWVGADHGIPAFYLIAGTDPSEVTRRLQRLVGSTPLPPLWALGHHQCRYGYRGSKDLNWLDAEFRERAFPCDGLWLDIDYMDDFKVFTTSPRHFSDLSAELAALEERGRRIVPILDPGVKAAGDVAVAQSGLARNVFCHNPEGQPYVGFVWPGQTWYPDFSLADARAWWAEHVAAMRDAGFHGAWIDMNDPSVGGAEHDDMLFQHGAWPHWTYHNQYAAGMAEATHAGFLQARPQERPFVVSRSAAAGSSRWAAVWTGDNFSNWANLRSAVHGSLNLALSGIPFNGADVPGFLGHADRELAAAWYKAMFLFPFLRNHADALAAPQEPWVFGPETFDVIRHFVRLRYKLLPYLYQLWIEQAERGDPVLRPLFFEHDGPAEMDLSRVDDQFLIGPAIMQAPLLHANTVRRSLALPGVGWWFDASAGRFVEAGQWVQVESDRASTPLYLREGHIVPMQVGERESQHNDLDAIELHVLLRAGSDANAFLRYRADDGLSFAYREGERSEILVRARREGRCLLVDVEAVRIDWKPIALRIVGYDGADVAHVRTPAGSATHALSTHPWRCAGASMPLRISAPFVIGDSSAA